MRVAFSERAWSDYLNWQQKDGRMLRRINQISRDIQRDPFGGIGKPEPLRHDWSGYWSRRIDDEHRLIYRVSGEVVELAALEGHY